MGESVRGPPELHDSRAGVTSDEFEMTDAGASGQEEMRKFDNVGKLGVEG